MFGQQHLDHDWMPITSQTICRSSFSDPVRSSSAMTEAALLDHREPLSSKQALRSIRGPLEVKKAPMSIISTVADRARTKLN